MVFSPRRFENNVEPSISNDRRPHTQFIPRNTASQGTTALEIRCFFKIRNFATRSHRVANQPPSREFSLRASAGQYRSPVPAHTRAAAGMRHARWFPRPRQSPDDGRRSLTRSRHRQSPYPPGRPACRALKAMIKMYQI